MPIGTRKEAYFLLLTHWSDYRQWFVIKNININD